MSKKTLYELNFVFSQLPPSYRNKIPKEILEKANSNKGQVKNVQFDESKPFTKQTLSKKSLEILDIILHSYLLS